MEGQFCYHIGVWSGMACATWDTEVDWQRRFTLDMRKYPNVHDSTNHTIVIPVVLVKLLIVRIQMGFTPSHIDIDSTDVTISKL